MKEEEREELKDWLDKIEMPEELRTLYIKDVTFRKLSHSGNKTVHLFDKVNEVIPHFYMKSGELAFTTIGSIEHCYKLMWEFPKGSFKLELGRDNKYDVAVITFKRGFKNSIQLPILFNKIHPEDKTSETSLFPIIQGKGSQLRLIDNEIWDQEKTSIYSDDYNTVDTFLTKYEQMYPGQLITFGIKDEEADNLVSYDKTTHEYEAFAGFDKDGRIVYLLIKSYSENYRRERTINLK
ncbi:MAG: hypothetical protein NTY74_12185 [Ignavibacteriae bacterium]|nr:hypothetical protein [Ignavibacteriota bacterium]